MLIQVVTGTTRQGRFSQKVAAWVAESLDACGDLQVELVDLRDHPLPFFDGVPPARAPREYASEEVAGLGGD
jgi:NAD(P)H-dependent FMN reductase